MRGSNSRELSKVLFGLVLVACGVAASDAYAASGAPTAPRPDPPPIAKPPPPPPPPPVRVAPPPPVRVAPPPPVRVAPPPPVRVAPPPPVRTGPTASQLTAQRRAARLAAQRRAAQRAAKRRAAQARAAEAEAKRIEARRAARERVRREAERRRVELAGSTADSRSPVAGAAPIAIGAFLTALLLLGLAFVPAHNVPWYWAERILVDRRDQFLMVGAAGVVAAGLLFVFAFLGS